MASKPSVVILGGGIAGISAAVALLEHDYLVTLVESRQFLGGRAFSFTDAQTGEQVDNGQHVIVGSCTAFRDLLRRMGLEERWYVQPRLRIRVLDRQGKEGFLKAGGLPSPMHLLLSFLTYPHLTSAEKFGMVKALIKARFINRSQTKYQHMTFYQWLKGEGQSEQVIQNVWNFLVKPTLNDDVRDVSAAMGLMIVQDGMLQDYHSADMGYALTSLRTAIGDPAKEYLVKHGCRLLLGSPAARLKIHEHDNEVAGAILANGEVVTSDVYLCALPAANLQKLLPETLIEESPLLRRLKGLETSPIVNIHLWYDRPVMDGDFCAFVDSPLQWVFNRTAIEGKADGSGQWVCISVSAAWDCIDRTREELAEMFTKEMEQVFPRAREGKVVRSVVVKQRNATFRCLPGANDLRPGPSTPWSNLFLAGEWTNTGWPSTMEGAVRSGYNAAEVIIASGAIQSLNG